MSRSSTRLLLYGGQIPAALQPDTVGLFLGELPSGLSPSWGAQLKDPPASWELEETQVNTESCGQGSKSSPERLQLGCWETGAGQGVQEGRRPHLNSPKEECDSSNFHILLSVWL